MSLVSPVDASKFLIDSEIELCEATAFGTKSPGQDVSEKTMNQQVGTFHMEYTKHLLLDRIMNLRKNEYPTLANAEKERLSHEHDLLKRTDDLVHATNEIKSLIERADQLTDEIQNCPPDEEYSAASKQMQELQSVAQHFDEIFKDKPKVGTVQDFMQLLQEQGDKKRGKTSDSVDMVSKQEALRKNIDKLSQSLIKTQIDAKTYSCSGVENVRGSVSKSGTLDLANLFDKMLPGVIKADLNAAERCLKVKFAPGIEDDDPLTVAFTFDATGNVVEYEANDLPQAVNAAENDWRVDRLASVPVEQPCMLSAVVAVRAACCRDNGAAAVADNTLLDDLAVRDEVEALRERFALDWRSQSRQLTFLTDDGRTYEISVGLRYPAKPRDFAVRLRQQGRHADGQPDAVSTLCDLLEYLSEIQEAEICEVDSC